MTAQFTSRHARYVTMFLPKGNPMNTTGKDEERTYCVKGMKGQEQVYELTEGKIYVPVLLGLKRLTQENNTGTLLSYRFQRGELIDLIRLEYLRGIKGY